MLSIKVVLAEEVSVEFFFHFLMYSLNGDIVYNIFKYIPTLQDELKAHSSLPNMSHRCKPI